MCVVGCSLARSWFGGRWQLKRHQKSALKKGFPKLRFGEKGNDVLFLLQPSDNAFCKELQNSKRVSMSFDVHETPMFTNFLC